MRDIVIHPMKKRMIRRAFGLYWSYKDKTGMYYISLSTKSHRSTIRTLIHEIHHQCLHEFVSKHACDGYDNIYKPLEQYILTKE